MNKIGHVLIVVGLVIAAYILLLVTMPVLTDVVVTSNATMSATSNMTNYPGASEALVSAPWGLFFVPGVIGIIAIVVILRRP